MNDYYDLSYDSRLDDQAADLDYGESPLLFELLQHGKQCASVTVSAGPGALFDIHPCGWSGCIYSTRLSRLIDSLKGPADRLEWFPVTVCRSDLDVPNTYYALQTEGFPETLDKWRSRFRTLLTRRVSDLIVPVLRLDKLVGHEVFYVESTHLDIIVSRRVRSEIELSSMTGIAFSPVRVK